jgi:glycosyltransferase involved in cell wall biosynthesis
MDAASLSCCPLCSCDREPWPAAARNVGWRAARGEIIAFTDDDCLPDPGWLRAGLAAFTDEVVAAWGAVHMPVPLLPTDYEKNAAQLAHAPFVTANCFVRRDALVALGGFDERFTSAWREDSDLFFSLLESHARIIHTPEAIVVHPIRPAPWGVSLRQQRKSLFNALLYKKHPALYRSYIQAMPPWRYYRIVSALLLSVGGAIIGAPGLTVGATGAWLLMTARFCVQRLSQTASTVGHIAEMIFTSVLIPPLSVFWRLRGALRFRVWFL